MRGEKGLKNNTRHDFVSPHSSGDAQAQVQLEATLRLLYSLEWNFIRYYHRH